MVAPEGAEGKEAVEVEEAKFKSSPPLHVPGQKSQCHLPLPAERLEEGKDSGHEGSAGFAPQVLLKVKEIGAQDSLL